MLASRTLTAEPDVRVCMSKTAVTSSVTLDHAVDAKHRQHEQNDLYIVFLTSCGLWEHFLPSPADSSPGR